jgi:hypothetical protein
MTRNKRSIFCISISIFIAFNLSASINPIYKECLQRGYQIEGNHCVFPDSTKCLLESFNKGECGKEWMTDDYCIPEGNHVWDAERCCEGLVAYLPEGMAGQATCQRKSEVKLKNTFLDSYWGLGLVILILLVILLLLRRKKRIN